MPSKTKPVIIGVPWNFSTVVSEFGQPWKSSRYQPKVLLPRNSGKTKYYTRRITNELVSEISDKVLELIPACCPDKTRAHFEIINSIINILLKKPTIIWDDSMSLASEIWKPIKWAKNYLVSNMGRIRNIKTNKLLRLNITKKRYRLISICKNGVVKKIGVHLLVLEMFGGKRPSNNHVCMHIDNNPANNHISNLKWGTQEQNMQQCIADGRFSAPQPPLRFGKDHHFSKKCFKYKGNRVVREYESINDAAANNNIKKTTMRRRIDNKERVGGFLYTLKKIA